MRSVCAVITLFLAAVATTGAQENTASRGPLFMLASANPTRAPVLVEAGSVAALRRRVSLSLDGVQLTDALAEIARAAGLQIVFADGVVPATARVHLRAEEITVAAALTDVLLDARVDVVLLPGGSVVLVKRGTWAGGSVAGRVTDARTGHGVPGARVSLQGTSLGTVTNDSGGFRIANVPPGKYTVTVRRIGYVQGTQAITVTADQEGAVTVRLEVSASPLDAVVVTGTIGAAERKELPNPITVVTGQEIQDRGVTQINDLFRGDIPGVFTADYGASSATIGAPVYVRGKTQLEGEPALKTYIDGVEIANSQFLNEIDPTMIDHIEIVRGPEASTLYGAQAINGVMQVFTKKGTLATAPRLVASLGLGSLEGPYGTSVRHQDNVTLSGGTADLSYNVGATYQHDGAWTVRHSMDVYSGYGSLSIQPSGSPVRVDVMARMGRQRSRTGGREGIAQGIARAMIDGTLQLDQRIASPAPDLVLEPQQTLGLSVHYAPWPTWQQSLTLGIDRGADGTDHVLYPSFTTPADSFTNVYSTQTSRTTASYNSAFDLQLAEGVSANVIVGADYWSYQGNSFYDFATTTDVGSLGTDGFLYLARDRDHNTGVFSQVRLGVADALFLTGGVRVDQGPALPEDRHHRSTNPRVGASYTFTAGPLRAKLRAGWGSALKPALPTYKQYIQFAPTYAQLAAPNLLPERQRGWDAGVELYAGDRASLSVTHYRQVARDLISFAYIAFDPVFEYQYLNLARVRNTGWELEGTLLLPAGLAARATYSQVASVIEAVAPQDQSGYQVGDPLPGVPHHTGALTLSERTPRLSAEAGVSYVGSSVNYDVRAWFQRSHIRIGTQSGDNPRVALPAAYRLGLRLAYDLTPRLALFAHCENVTNRVVLDQGYFASDQIGRSTLVGLRVR